LPTYALWDQRFQELVDFKKIYGHANFPTKVGPLGRWRTTQRMRYGLLKEGKDSPLTIDECEKLESIGFEFKCQSIDSPWDQHFQELVHYKKINGHTNVHTGSGPLGRWVDDERKNYRLLKEGKDSPMTLEKREKLESIGFEFKCQPRSSWDQRFQELVDYKKINGHANVSTHSGPLGTWIARQRTHYRLLQEGKDSRLTVDNREKLESIGFEFTSYRATTFLSWDQRFQELVDYKKINGHTNVPHKLGALGGWVGFQRRHYHLLKEGKHSPLTIDQWEKLESIGFEFTIGLVFVT